MSTADFVDAIVHAGTLALVLPMVFAVCFVAVVAAGCALWRALRGRAGTTARRAAGGSWRRSKGRRKPSATAADELAELLAKAQLAPATAPKGPERRLRGRR